MEFRRFREREKQRDLALAKNRLREEEDKLELLNCIRDECQKETKNRKKDRINIKELSLYQVYLSRLYHQIKRQKSEVDKSQGQVESEREGLLEKSKEKKALENLKKTRLLHYKEYINRLEQKTMDELARDVALREKKK